MTQMMTLKGVSYTKVEDSHSNGSKFATSITLRVQTTSDMKIARRFGAQKTIFRSFRANPINCWLPEGGGNKNFSKIRLKLAYCYKISS